jgi:hypothetical protein
MLLLQEAYMCGPQDELSSDATTLLDKLDDAWQARTGGAGDGRPAAVTAPAAAGHRAHANSPAATVSPLRRAAARQARQQGAGAVAPAPTARQPAGAVRPATQSPRPLKRRAITRLSQEGF